MATVAVRESGQRRDSSSNDWNRHRKQPESPRKNTWNRHRKQPESPRPLRSGASLRSSSLVALTPAVLASSAVPERPAPFIPTRLGWSNSLCGWE